MFPRRMLLSVRAAPNGAGEGSARLARLDLPVQLVDDARLLVSELVTNSVRHAGLGQGDLIRVIAEWPGR